MDWMRALVDTGKKFWNEYKEKLASIKDKNEKAEIARLFNNRYTFLKEYVPDKERLPGTAMGGLTPRGGYAWMCPECNQIYHPYESTVFSGLQYPKCCHTPQGNRLYNDIQLP